IPAVGSLVSPPPLILIEDGCLVNENMQQELLTEEELMSQLRQQGVESVEKVKRAYMEADGRISVITKGNG
ncbi:MAG: YetF domain-containing protein, partial [Cyanobacteria bacterium J06629_18]